MSFGAGYGNRSGQTGGPFRREEEDAAEQTFEFQRLTGNELGTWPPPAPSPAVPPQATPPPAAWPPPASPPAAWPTAAPPQAAPPEDAWPTAAPPRAAWPTAAPPPAVRPFADVTRDLQRGPARRRARTWLVAAGVAVVAAAGTVVGLLAAPGSGPAAQDGSTARLTAAPGRHTSPASRPASATNPVPAGLASCPVGTSRTAAALANALARDPVYVDPASPLLTAAQARRLRAEIGRYDPGRIRIAAVRAATARRGGGQRVLANAIASCSGDGAGTTLVVDNTSAYLVTSYAADTPASQAVAAALNTHATLAGGLADAIRRITIVDKSSH
jgi:hypothetical protein